jgi:NhaA family Na+:H+ antiporter
VKLSASTFEVTQRPILLGVVLGLAVGKPVGITLGSWLAVRLGVAVLPKGLRWSHVALVGMLGGVGFTVSLFIATLAFARGATLDAAKSAVLVASTISGSLSLLVGRAFLKHELVPGAAQTESEAEQATDR